MVLEGWREDASTGTTTFAGNVDFRYVVSPKIDSSDKVRGVVIIHSMDRGKLLTP